MTDDDAEKEATIHMADPGRVTWHTSDADGGGGPDVGITIGLGDGVMLWAGEITRQDWVENQSGISHLGPATGWWLVRHPEREPIAKFVSPEAARGLSELLERLIRRAPPP